MTWAELEAIAERRRAEKRLAQEPYVRKLCDRLIADGFDAEAVEDAAEGWVVRVRYPASVDVWITVRCVVAGGQAQFEWCRHLPSICAADDVDTAASYLHTLLNVGVPLAAFH
jgi:hypothetical protein